MSTDPQRLGKYELRERLPGGGQGEVWKAFDLQLRRYVAIKQFHADLQSDPDFIERFQREAQFIASLHHPHIVQIHDFQTLQTPGSDKTTAYMVMDYIEGPTLAAYIRNTSRKGLFPSAADIIYIFTGVSLALDYAHGKGMIHGDIKPANIILDERASRGRSIGQPTLTDFGMAKLQGVSARITHSLDTLLYIAPEQAQGLPGDKRSDLYSLGIILYEMATGTTPFRGDSMTALLMQHFQDLPTPPALINPQIPPALSEVILKSIEKSPEARFQSASALTIALAQALNLPVPAELRRNTSTPDIASSPPERIHVFFSYAHRDQNLRDQLENHLSNLKYRGLITTWHAREIRAGEETIQQIDIHLDTAHLILLLISANFLASEYCYSREMLRALERHERGEAQVIPVLLRPVLFTDAPFARLQPLPTNGKPVVNWRNRDSAFVDIAVGIERVVQERLASAARQLHSYPYASAGYSSSESNLPIALDKPLPVTPYPADAYSSSESSRSGTSAVSPPPPPSPAPVTPLPFGGAPSRRRRGLILVGLSLLGLLSAGVLLVQHPNFIPFVGAIVGSLILLAGILLALRALVKRAQSRAARRPEQEQAHRQHLEAENSREQQREQQRQEERRREQEEARRPEQEQAHRQHLEAARRRELEEVRRPEQERAYYEKALVAYEQALRQNNADATALRGKGNALVGLSRYDEALSAFEHALTLTLIPHPATYVSKGNVLGLLGRYDEAVSAYEQALRLDATYASAYTGLSEALSHLGRTQEAEQASAWAKQLGEED